MAKPAKAEEKIQNNDQQNKIETPNFILRCKNSSRDTGLCVMPNENCNFYNIVKIIQKNTGHFGITPHIHLIFPFLPKESFNDIYKIITHFTMEFKSFEIRFKDIIRKEGTGKQYVYLVCDDLSKDILVKMQKSIMIGLCDALRNGQKPKQNQHKLRNLDDNDEEESKSNKRNNKKNGNGKKKGKKKNKHKPKNKNKNLSENEEKKTCLEQDIRNVEFDPHLSIGQLNEKEFKIIRNMVLSAFEETQNESDNEKIESEQELFRQILHFKVDNLYMINARRGTHVIHKTIVLK